MTMFDFLKPTKSKFNSPEQLMEKVRGYADAVDDAVDVQSLQAATMESIASFNALKIEAREKDDNELFEFLRPFSEYFLKSIMSSAKQCASNKSTSMELWLRCEDWSKKKDGHTYSSYIFDSDRTYTAIRFGQKLILKDVEYEFADELSSWRYFYMFERWVISMLVDRGFSCTPRMHYSKSSVPAGWSEEMDSITYDVSWGDESFVENAKKLTDPSQVEAFRAGVPLEDIVA